MLAQNELTEIEIPEGVEEIEEFAFFKNKLTNIELPYNIKKLFYGVFDDNQVTSLTFFGFHSLMCLVIMMK